MASFRPSTLAERKRFYEREFDVHVVQKWLPRQPQFYALDLGKDSQISTTKMQGLLIVGPNITLTELRNKLLDYLPEDVYYDTCLYRNPAKCIEGETFLSEPHNYPFQTINTGFAVFGLNISAFSIGIGSATLDTSPFKLYGNLINLFFVVTHGSMAKSLQSFAICSI